MSHVQYLDYIIDEKGMHLDPNKIWFIWDWSTPTTLTKSHSFLDLANFCRRFVLGFFHITWPLSQVITSKEKVNFFWSESQQKVFFELKYHLFSAIVVTLLDLQQPFDIVTNASNYAIRVVLTQEGHLVAYHNETISNAICKYPTYNKEMYSIASF